MTSVSAHFGFVSIVIALFASDWSRKSNEDSIDFHQVYVDSELCAANDGKIEKLLEKSSKASSGESEEDENRISYHASIWTQQIVLLKKTLLSYWRNPQYTLIRALMMILLSFLYGAAYWQAAQKKGDDFSQSTVVSIVGVLFNTMTFMGAITANLSIDVVSVEKAPFVREKASRMYSAVPYIVAYTAAEVVSLAIPCIIGVLIFFFMVGFDPTAGLIFAFLGVYYLFVLTMTFFGHMMVAVFPSSEVALIVSGLSLSMFSMFAGFLIGADQVVPFWKFMTYIVPTRYGLNALAVLFMNCQCSTAEVLTLLNETFQDDSFNGCSRSEIDDLGCKIVDTLGGDSTAWQVLEDVYGFDNSRMGLDLMALVIFLVVFRIVTLIGYAFFNFDKR